MQLKHVGRILAVLGGLLLISSVITWLIGAHAFVTIKVTVALAFFAVFFATNWRHIGTSSAGRSSFFVGISAVSGVAVIALLCMLNYVAVKRPMSWDFTSNRIHQLSPSTHSILLSLQQDVHALAFLRADDESYEPLQTLFKKYENLNPRFHFEFIDPIKDPLRVSQMNIRHDGPRVILQSEGRESRFMEPTEEALTNALQQVTRTERKKVGFTAGRGEVRIGDNTELGLSQIAGRMESEGLEPFELQIGETELPEDIEVIVIAGPQQPFDRVARNTLRQFILRGGRLLILLDPTGDSSLEPFLNSFDLSLERALIVDSVSRLQGSGETSPLIQNYNPNEEITRAFGIATVFPTVAPVKLLLDDPQEGLSLTELAMTSPDARLRALLEPLPVPTLTATQPQTSENPNEDEITSNDSASATGTGTGTNEAMAQASTPVLESAKGTPDTAKATIDESRKGPFPIAARVTGRLPPKVEGGLDREFRIVLIGDKDFATNGYRSLLGNEDFFLNSLNWLASHSERITIRPKLRTASRLYLTPERQAMLTFFLIDLLPISILAFGLTLWMIRRSK